MMIVPETTVVALKEQKNVARWRIIRLANPEQYPKWADGEHLDTMERVFLTNINNVGEVVYYPTEKIAFDKCCNRFTPEQIFQMTKPLEITEAVTEKALTARRNDPQLFGQTKSEI